MARYLRGYEKKQKRTMEDVIWRIEHLVHKRDSVSLPTREKKKGKAMLRRNKTTLSRDDPLL